MDIQLHMTEEELKEFPEDIPDHTDLDIAPSNPPITPTDIPRAKGFLGDRQSGDPRLIADR